jgi:hypothetical protein
MSGNSFNFGPINQVASGAGAVNQIGNNTATTHVGREPVPTVEEVFSAIEKELPPEEAGEIKSAVLQPLMTLAQLPPKEQASEDVMEQAEPLYARLVPYAPQIGKGLLAFGEAALSALASSNPIIAGLLAVCKVAKSSVPAAQTPPAPSPSV